MTSRLFHWGGMRKLKINKKSWFTSPYEIKNSNTISSTIAAKHAPTYPHKRATSPTCLTPCSKTKRIFLSLDIFLGYEDFAMHNALHITRISDSRDRTIINRTRLPSDPNYKQGANLVHHFSFYFSFSICSQIKNLPPKWLGRCFATNVGSMAYIEPPVDIKISQSLLFIFNGWSTYVF